MDKSQRKIHKICLLKYVAIKIRCGKKRPKSDKRNRSGDRKKEKLEIL